MSVVASSNSPDDVVEELGKVLDPPEGLRAELLARLELSVRSSSLTRSGSCGMSSIVAVTLLPQDRARLRERVFDVAGRAPQTEGSRSRSVRESGSILVATLW